MTQVIDWSECPEVEATPGKVFGKWCFKGTRLPLYTLFASIGDINVNEFAEGHDVAPERVKAVLEWLRVKHNESVFSDEENLQTARQDAELWTPDE